jgi:hypothetical protein
MVTFLRAAAPELLATVELEERAELDLTLQEHVARLMHFASGIASSSADSVSPLRRADQLVKTLIASGLLRNRGSLKKALYMGLEAALPHWILFSKTAHVFSMNFPF